MTMKTKCPVCGHPVCRITTTKSLAQCTLCGTSDELRHFVDKEAHRVESLALAATQTPIGDLPILRHLAEARRRFQADPNAENTRTFLRMADSVADVMIDMLGVQ